MDTGLAYHPSTWLAEKSWHHYWGSRRRVRTDGMRWSTFRGRRNNLRLKLMLKFCKLILSPIKTYLNWFSSMMAVIEHYFLFPPFLVVLLVFVFGCWFFCFFYFFGWGVEDEVWVYVLTLYVFVITSCSDCFSIFSFSSHCLGGGGKVCVLTFYVLVITSRSVVTECSRAREFVCRLFVCLHEVACSKTQRRLKTSYTRSG